jgi:predicted transcriptional regulator
MHITKEELEEMRRDSKLLPYLLSAKIEWLLAEVVAILASRPKLPEKYEGLRKVLIQYVNEDFAKAIVEFADSQKRPPELQKKLDEIIRRWVKRKHSKEWWYNMICEEYPNERYGVIHRWFLGRGDMAADVLRKYKERRIEKTSDFRESPPFTKKDKEKIRNIFRRNNYRMTEQELVKASPFKKSETIQLIKLMNIRGEIKTAKDTKDGQRRGVLVLKTNKEMQSDVRDEVRLTS